MQRACITGRARQFLTADDLFAGFSENQSRLCEQIGPKKSETATYATGNATQPSASIDIPTQVPGGHCNIA